MQKLIPTTLIACALLSACIVKDSSKDEIAHPSQSDSSVVQYQAKITGRACVAGLSMIKLNFNDILGNYTWVYEQVPSNGGGVFRPVLC